MSAFYEGSGKKNPWAFTPLARLNGLGNDRLRWLFQHDERDFKDMLTDWMVALNCTPQKETAKFLEKAGLKNIISPDDWQGLLDGTKAPGHKLGCHLSVLMHEAVVVDKPTPLVFRHRACAVALNRELPQVELSDEDCHAIRAPLVERILKNNSKAAATLPANDKVTRCIVEQVQKLYPEVEKEEILEKLASHYRADAEDVISVIKQLVLNQVDADLEQWAAAALQPSQGAGSLLYLLRQCNGMTQETLANALKVTPKTIRNWEQGIYEIEAGKLAMLHAVFHLGNEEMLKLTQLVRPELSEEYIIKQLHTGKIEYLVFSALDPEWLNTQPQFKQSGLLLSALRGKVGLTRETLAESIGVSRKTIKKWELGSPIPQERIKKLIGVFTGLESFDPEYFREVCERSCGAIKTLSQTKPHSTHVGAIVPTHTVPSEIRPEVPATIRVPA